MTITQAYMALDVVLLLKKSLVQIGQTDHSV